MSPGTSLWLSLDMWGPHLVSQVWGVYSAASSPDACTLVDALLLTHCLTAAGHIMSWSICFHICEIVVGLGYYQGPCQLGGTMVWAASGPAPGGFCK